MKKNTFVKTIIIGLFVLVMLMIASAAPISLTSTSGTGFLYTDYTQFEDLFQDGGVEATAFAVSSDTPIYYSSSPVSYQVFNTTTNRMEMYVNGTLIMTWSE